MQLWDVMRFLTTYNGDDYDGYKLPERLYKAYLMDDEYVFKGAATPENVMNWINTSQDNNDGGILLKVNMDRYGNMIESGELYIFNDPEMGRLVGNMKRTQMQNQLTRLIDISVCESI